MGGVSHPRPYHVVLGGLITHRYNKLSTTEMGGVSHPIPCHVVLGGLITQSETNRILKSLKYIKKTKKLFNQTKIWEMTVFTKKIVLKLCSMHL